MALSFVMAQPMTGRLIEGRQKIERDIRRLVIRGIRSRNVSAQRSDRAFTRKRPDCFGRRHLNRMPSGNQARGDRLDVALNARNLTGEKYLGTRSKLQRCAEQRRPIDVCVAVNLSVSDELGFVEARDHLKNSRLICKTHVVLKTD